MYLLVRFRNDNNTRTMEIIYICDSIEGNVGWILRDCLAVALIIIFSRYHATDYRFENCVSAVHLTPHEDALERTG